MRARTARPLFQNAGRQLALPQHFVYLWLERGAGQQRLEGQHLAIGASSGTCTAVSTYVRIKS